MHTPVKARAARPADEVVSTDVDRRFLLSPVTWDQYVKLRELLDELPGVRMTYLEGQLELMSPSLTHEYIKKMVARLVEIYALERDVDLNGYGQMTFKKKAKKRGVEPDECWCIGSMRRNTPHIAFEVEMTRGALDKLSVYAGLGVPELWFWRDGKIHLLRLRGTGYVARETSRYLPGLDLAEVAGFIGSESQTAAVRAFRDRLRARR